MKAILAAFPIVLITFSCAFAAPPDKSGDSRIKTQSTLALENIIKGISEGDYGLYTMNFSQAMKSSQTREIFLDLQKNFQKNLGKFQSMQYLGFLRQSDNIIALFKARFSKEKDDVEVRLVLDETENPKVTGLWFDCPSLTR